MSVLHHLQQEPPGMITFDESHKIDVRKINLNQATLDSCFKGAPMQTWKSANIFIFIGKQYVEDFRLKHLLLFDVCAHEICENFVYKHLETIEYVKN